MGLSLFLVHHLRRPYRQYKWRRDGMRIGDEVMCAAPLNDRGWVFGRITDFTATQVIISIEAASLDGGRGGMVRIYKAREDVFPTKETLDRTGR